jgi:hypothetical protein
MAEIKIEAKKPNSAISKGKMIFAIPKLTCGECRKFWNTTCSTCWHYIFKNEKSIIYRAGTKGEKINVYMFCSPICLEKSGLSTERKVPAHARSARPEEKTFVTYSKFKIQKQNAATCDSYKHEPPQVPTRPDQWCTDCGKPFYHVDCSFCGAGDLYKGYVHKYEKLTVCSSSDCIHRAGIYLNRRENGDEKSNYGSDSDEEEKSSFYIKTGPNEEDYRYVHKELEYFCCECEPKEKEKEKESAVQPKKKMRRKTLAKINARKNRI